MEITLTPKARKELTARIDRGEYMKLTLEKVGCCGLGFFVAQGRKRDDDVMEDVEGLSLAVSKTVWNNSTRLKVDYKRIGLRKDFHVTAN